MNVFFALKGLIVYVFLSVNLLLQRKHVLLSKGSIHPTHAPTTKFESLKRRFCVFVCFDLVALFLSFK